MDTLFIAGAWRPARDAQTRTIHCPADGREVVTVAEASEADARDAVAAARAAFDDGPWPRMPAPERGALLRRLAGRRVVVFLDYDGVLTLLVDRPVTA